MLIEIIRQSLYTRDIQPTSKPLQICGHLRSCYVSTGCYVTHNYSKIESPTHCRKTQKSVGLLYFARCMKMQ